MNRSYRLLTMSLILFFGLSPALVIAEKGEEEGISLHGAHEVSTNSIVYHPNHIVSMWVKLVPEENTKTMRYIHRRLKEKQKDYKAYEYSSFLVEIDCQKGVHRQLSIMHYNKHKNILHAVNAPEAQWQTADSQNGFHMLHVAFCSGGRSLAYSLK